MAYDLRFDVSAPGAESLSAVDAIIQKLSGSTKTVSGDLRIFESVLRADVAAGISLNESLKTIASSSDAGSAGIKKLAKEAQGLAKEAKLAQDEVQKLGRTMELAQAENAARDAKKFADSIKELGGAHAGMIPQVAAASAAIRTFEGAMPIRAVERFAVNVLGLGPILQAAFPLIGLVAFAEIFYRTFEKIDPFIQAEKRLAEQTKKTGQEFAQLGKELERLQIAQAAADSGPAAGKKLAAFYSTSDAKSDEANVKYYTDLIARNKKDIDALSADYNYQVSHPSIGGIFASGATFEEGRVIQAKSKDNETYQQILDGLKEKGLVATQRTRTDKAEEDKDNRRTSSEAAKEAARRAEERAKSVNELGRKALNPVEQIYSRDDETRRDFAARGNAFSPAEMLQRNAGVTADANAEIKKQITEQRKYPLALTGSGFATSGAEAKPINRTLGPDGENDMKRVGEIILSGIREYNTAHNKEVNETGEEAVRKNASAGGFADKMTGLNPVLTDAQKIVALNLQDLETAKQKYQIELDTASHLATDAEIKDATHKADLANEVELQRLKEENAERIAELEDKQIADFRSAIGGLFDAVVSHAPRAIPNFVKSQVLGQAQTFTENAAQSFLLPTLQSIGKATGINSALTKGTWLQGGDKNTPVISAIVDVKTEVSKVVAALRGQADPDVPGSGSGVGGAPGSLAAGVNSGNTNMSDLANMAYGPSSILTALATSASGGGGGFVASLAKALPAFGAGASSVLSGNALSLLMGDNPRDVNGIATSQTTTASQIGAGVGLAGAAAAGGFEIYQGLKQGGIGGDLKAGGAAAGLVGTAVSNIAKLIGAASPLLSAIPIVGSALAVVLPLIGGLFNGPQQRANAINTELGAAQYVAPQALNVTQSSNGNFTDFDARGNIRTSNFSAVPTVRQGSIWEQTHGLFDGPPTFYNVPGGQTSQYGAVNPSAPVINHIYQAGAIQTMDAGSFDEFAKKNSIAIANAASKAMQNGHGALTTEVQRAAAG